MTVSISMLSEFIPIGESSPGWKHSTIKLPVPRLDELTRRPAEASCTVSSDNLTVPTMPSLVGKATSQTFSFGLPNVLSTANTSSSQIKQPTLNFSMPVSSTSTTKSSAGLRLSSPLGMEMAPSVSSASLGMGTALGVPSSQGTGLGLPSSSLGAGFKLQLPNSTTTTTTTANTVQLQTNLLHTSKYYYSLIGISYSPLPVDNTVVTSSGQVGTLFSANTTGTNINFSASNKPSIFPTLATGETWWDRLVFYMGSFHILSDYH